MKPALRFLALAAILTLAPICVAPARADNTAQSLPFTQNWANTGLITTNDIWSGVPGIEGFRGDGLTAANDVDPRTVLAADDPGVLDVNANQTNPNTFATGGVTEFDIVDDVVALTGSGTADAPYLRLYLNTTGQSNITVQYNLRDIDGSVDNAAQQVALHYRVGASGTWTDVPAAYVADATTGPSLATLITPVCVVLPAATSNQAVVQLRVITTNATGNDEWVGVDDVVVTSAGCGGSPNLSIDNVTLAEGDAGTTNFLFTVTLSAAAGAGGVTFDIATADGTAEDDNPPTEDNDYVAQVLTVQTIAAGSSTYNFTVAVNGDAVVEPNETFLVNVTLVTGANVVDGQGQGTIGNDDVPLSFIHDVQGSGASTPVPGTTVRVIGVVVGDFQSGAQLQGFFLEEESADFDANPDTSEGIFVFCGGCPTTVNLGDQVQVVGTAQEFFGMTEISATTAPSLTVLSTGNPLPSPAVLDLPVVGVINDYYEPREAMRVSFTDTLTVAEYFELARFGQVELYEGGRPRQFTEAALPNVAGYAAHLDNLARRRVILDDDDNAQNSPLSLADGFEFLYHPQANGGLSIGAHGTDFFRGGDLVTALTGVLDWSWSGLAGTDAWRVRPTGATSATFTATNLRPATPPAVGGAIQVAAMNLLNYFSTVDAGPNICGPAANQDCRGADSAAELNRQRERASIVICGLDAHVVAFGELENTTAAGAINDLLGAVNALCGGADPYLFASTGSTLGTDAIRVAIIYRSVSVAPVGAPVVDLDPVHNRPPTAQTFDVIDPANPAVGERFTAIANHFKSKGCGGAGGADLDQGDGQGCFNATRTAQAARLLTWINGSVIPAAGDPDVVLLGDFNSYARENPVTTLVGGGFTDVEDALLGASAYSYLFDGQLGHLDYAFTSASLTPDVTGVGAWHINADEVPDFDYNDEIVTAGEASFEKKADGSLLVPPRVLFQAASPYRASDHDPVLLGLFFIADLSLAKTDAPDPVVVGTNLTYTITVSNGGPNAATNAMWSDTLPAGTTFVSMPAVAGWGCTAPAPGSGGTVSCLRASFPVGASFFTLTVEVNPALAGGTVLDNAATVDSDTAEGNPGNEIGTASTTVLSPAAISATKTVGGDTIPGGTIFYEVVLTNASAQAQGDYAGDEFIDILPSELDLVGVTASAGTALAVPATNTVTWNGPIPGGGSVTITIEALIPPTTLIDTIIVNQGTFAYDADGNGTNEAAGVTDDPTLGGADDPTAFGVDPGVSILEIPAVGEWGLAALALTLLGAGLAQLGRRPIQR